MALLYALFRRLYILLDYTRDGTRGGSWDGPEPRKLKSKKRLYKVEDELIRFMKHQQKSKIGFLEDDLKQLREQMHFWKSQDFESIPFSKFDFGMWAQARLNKVLICDLYQQTNL